MGDQAGAGQVERHVAAHLAPVQRLQDHGEHGVVVPVGLGHHLAGLPLGVAGGHVQVVERHRVVGQYPAHRLPVLERVLEARAAAAGDGRADHAPPGVPVVGFRVGSQVHAGEAQRPRAVRLAQRVGQPEVVQVQGRLAVVHPVVVGVELAMDLAVARELTGHRLPQEAAALVQVGGAAQGVEQRPVVIALVAVVGAVHPRPARSPDEAAVGPGVALLVHGSGLLHHLDQPALAYRPVRRRADPGGFNRAYSSPP